MDDDLLIKYLLGEATAEETAFVKNKIAQDAAYHKYFEQFKMIWETSRKIAIHSTADENVAWQRFISRATYPTPSIKESKKYNFRWMKVAAAVVALIGFAYLTIFIINTQITPKEIAFQSLQQVLTDTLPDASVVTLNKNSTLTYPEKFNRKTRTVALKGEAFFKVTPHKEKPFIIAVNDVEVLVVGTSFNIKATNNQTEIVVETGLVQVIQNGKSILLKAGEKLNTSTGNTALAKEETKDKLYNYYRSKEFVCENTPLWKLVEVLNEAYGANISITNNSIKTLPITTTFYNESLDQVLLIISETFSITVTKKDNTIVLQ